MTRYWGAEWQDKRQKTDRGYQGESRQSERLDRVTMKLDNIQKSNVLLSFSEKIVTKVEVKQRKFASCLIEKKDRGGRGEGGLMEKAGTAKWRWAAITAFLLRGQVVLRCRHLHKEYCQRQEFWHSKGQTLASCEQKILVLESKVGIPERPKEEKEVKSDSLASLASAVTGLFSALVHIQRQKTRLCSVLEFPSPSPCLLHFWMPLDANWNYSCQTLSSSFSPVLYTSLFKWVVEEIKMNLYFTNTFFGCFLIDRKA